MSKVLSREPKNKKPIIVLGLSTQFIVLGLSTQFIPSDHIKNQLPGTRFDLAPLARLEPYS